MPPKLNRRRAMAVLNKIDEILAWEARHENERDTRFVDLGKYLSRLDADSYCELHRQVLERDGWRCQVCGSMLHLEVHHLRFRSQAGCDEEQNLITLCAECHARMHRKTGPTRPSCSD